MAIASGPGTAWHAALLVAVAATLAVLVAWAWTTAEEFPPVARGAVLGAATLACAAVVRLAARRPARVLRWTGARWELEVGPAGEAVGGDARVALDIGGWMLVRFEPSSPLRRLPIWVPLARAGQGADWHVLRCCLYALHRAPPS